MDIIKELKTINGNYLAILLAIIPFLGVKVRNVLKNRKDLRYVVSVINDCDERIFLDQFDDALDEYKNILRKHKLNKYNKAFILYNMGYVYYKISLNRDKEKKLKQELYYYNRVIKLFPEYDLFKWKIISKEKKKLFGYTMNGLARAYNDMAMIRKPEEFTNISIEASLISEKINRKYNEKYQLAITYSNLAVSYRTKFDNHNDKNDFEKAFKYNNCSLSLFKAMNHKKDIARVENNLGNLFMNKGFLEQKEKFINIGINHLENSKKMYEINNFPYEYARSCMNVGVAYFHRSNILSSKEDIDIGINNCETSIDVFGKLGSEIEKATASLNAIYLYQAKFSQSEDMKYLEKAYKYSSEIIEVINIVTNSVLSHKILLQKFSTSVSLYSMTHEGKYYDSCVEAYRSLENETCNFPEELDEKQLMIIMSEIYLLHFSLTENYESVGMLKRIYKKIYNNKKASKKDKFVSWSKYSEILVFQGEYDRAISEIELSIDLAEELFKEDYSQNDINIKSIENIILSNSDVIEQIHSIRNLIFIISKNKGNHVWYENIDEKIHRILSEAFGFESIILDPPIEKINEIFGMDFEISN